MFQPFILFFLKPRLGRMEVENREEAWGARVAVGMRGIGNKFKGN